MAYNYINRTGVVVPDTSTLLAEVQREFQNALGDDLDLSPQTPQGRMIAAEVLARSSVARNNADLANQINPNEAGGVHLFAIGALTGLAPTGATRTVIRNVTVTGVPNSTIIPQGALAETTAGDRFRTTQSVVIPGNGTATVDFESVNEGPVPAAANTLTRVISSVLGWETVNNATAGTLGVLEQSDANFRDQRRNTLGLQGRSVPVAMTSDVRNVPGVIGLQFRENIQNSTQVIDGITLVAHSTWMVVDGGTDTAVATAMLENKTAGAAWNGAVSVNVVNPDSGQTYTVLFDRPATVAQFIRVTVRRDDALGDVEALVRQAVLDYVAGDIPGEDGFQVGINGSPFEIGAAVNARVPGIYVAKVELSDDGTTYTTNEKVVALNQKLTTTSSSINVVIL